LGKPANRKLGEEIPAAVEEHGVDATLVTALQATRKIDHGLS
jgi:hypothetical protein